MRHIYAEKKETGFVLSVSSTAVSLQQMLKDRFVQFKIKRYKLGLLCTIFFPFLKELNILSSHLYNKSVSRKCSGGGLWDVLHAVQLHAFNLYTVSPLSVQLSSTFHFSNGRDWSCNTVMLYTIKAQFTVGLSKCIKSLTPIYLAL